MAACSCTSDATMRRDEEPVQRRQRKQEGHQHQLDREDDAVFGIDQRAKALELNDREHKAGQHQQPDERHRNGREPMKHTRQCVISPPRHRNHRRQRADPKGHGNTVHKKRRARVSHCGDAVAAWPLVASESPTPAIASIVSTQAIVMVGLRHVNPATAIAAIAISSDGPRLVASALVHGADVSEAAEGKIEQIETLQADRHHRADKADRKRAGNYSSRRFEPARSRPRRIPRRRRQTARDRPRSAPARSGVETR